MIERRQELGFAAEASKALGSRENSAGRTLMATSRLSFVSRER